VKTSSARIADLSPSASGVARPIAPRRHSAAFTLIELIVVLSMLALFVLVAQVSLFGALRRSEFNSQVQGFISIMHMAASAAAETGRRYEVIVDVADQSYLLRQITSSNLADVRDDEIIAQGQFGGNCYVSYVEFDDGDFVNDGKAKFRAGHSGWNYGGKVVFIDDGEQAHTVAVSRLTPIVELIDGDAELMKPKARDEVPSL